MHVCFFNCMLFFFNVDYVINIYIIISLMFGGPFCQIRAQIQAYTIPLTNLRQAW